MEEKLATSANSGLLATDVVKTDNNIDDANNIYPNTTTATQKCNRQQFYEKLSCSSKEDEDEYWDDAQALLQTDENVLQTLNNQQNDNSGHADKLNSITSIDNQSNFIDQITSKKDPSSSSAYSSIRSTNNDGSSIVNTTATNSAIEHPDLMLHKAVFDNDAEAIFKILNNVDLVREKNLINARDKHGNTALHLACMLGRSKKIVEAFLQGDTKWSIDTKNLNRWTPFHEACSYGDRDVIKLLAKQLSAEVDDALNGIKLSESLEKTKNYHLALKWEFQSWVPFFSRVLPSETCVINKQGRFIRIDTRLLDLESLFRKKGNSCLVYSNKKWIVMNNKTKKYEYFGNPNAFKDIDERVDELMSTDIMDVELKSSEMQLTRLTSGWIWKADKVGKVGRYNAALYDLSNVLLVMRKRREHLNEDDLKRNKNAYKSAVHLFEFGELPSASQRQPVSSNKGLDESASGQDEAEALKGMKLVDDLANEEESEEEDEDEVRQYRDSLPPPPPRNVTWEQYINADPGHHPILGREPKFKVSSRAVKASVAMSEEFPITKQEFLELLSVVPLKLFKKLKEFVELKLPDGFPVRFDLPIFPFLTARITFEDFVFHDGPIEESLFTVPSDYERDSSLLPEKLRSCSETTNDDK